MPVELAIVETSGETSPRGVAAWLESLRPELHHNINLTVPADLDRLCRLLLRRAVGIALSGGGARGFAHIGVINALREGGVPLDLFCGTSMGALVSGAASQGWDLEERSRQFCEDLRQTKPFREFTFPLVSLVRGRKISALLERNYAGCRIEDSRYNFFCVSTNLTRGDAQIHRVGVLWRALRASIALPGLLPPAIENGEVLVDGAMIANFPSDTLSEMRRGPVIGCDVGKVEGLRSMADGLDDRSLLWLLSSGRNDAPSIASILMSAATVSSTAQALQCREKTDLLLEPPIDSIPLLAWEAFDEAVELGYRYTQEVLEREDKKGKDGLFGLT